MQKYAVRWYVVEYQMRNTQKARLELSLSLHVIDSISR